MLAGRGVDPDSTRLLHCISSPMTENPHFEAGEDSLEVVGNKRQAWWT